MKKIKYILLSLLLAVFPAFAAGCDNTGNGGKTDPYALNLVNDDFTYFKDLKFNEAKHLKVFGTRKESGLGTHDLMVGVAIQGLFAQDEVSYYYDSTAYNELWLTDICDTYGVTQEAVTVASMVGDYLEKFGDAAGYILYDKQGNPQSLNVATSICGVTGYIPLDVSVQSKYEAMGLVKKLDVTERTEKWCFENYKDEFSRDGLFQLSTGHISTRDYAIACKYFCFYREQEDLESLMFRDQVQSWTYDDSPVFGWGPISEDSHVQISSEHSSFTIASDWSCNLSVYSCPSFFGEGGFRQKNGYERIEKEAKHYVCIVCSDGDNIQALSNTLAVQDKYFTAKRGDFPMGWNISPSAVDIQPSLQKYIYRNTGDRDYFVAAVSGQGYVYPSQYPDLADFCGRMATYLKRADLQTLQILDTKVDKDVMEYYSRIPGLQGVQYMVGDYYAAEGGSVYWSENGMPFVTCRLSLWEPETAQSLAAKINSYPVNPNSIEGYTLVNLHPWSRSYADVAAMVAALDADVEVVTSEQFFQLIRENVPHTDVSLKG